MNAASPGVISMFLQNAFYKTREAYLAALADAMKEEYETIVAAGLDLQLDCPDLALSRHMLFTDLADDEFVPVAETHVAALNHALRDIPMDKVFPAMMSARARYVMFQTSNPRHWHEWTTLRDRKAEVPDHKVLIPGVVDTTMNFVEHPELVAQRLERVTQIVGRHRVIAGSDGGFGTFAGFGAVDPDICHAKLARLADGAERV